MSDLLLTIAIPTYNRMDYIKENLSVLLPQVDKVKDKVEIVISDNASTDGTKDYVGKLVEKYPISYYCNKENIGADGNIIKCFNYAKADYLLVLSDDDILQPGALVELLNLLEKNPSFVYLNCCGFEGKYKDSYKNGNAAIKLQNNLITRDVNIFFEKIKINITFLSVLCYNMKLIKQIDRLDYYSKTNFIHVYIALITLGLARGQDYTISCKPLIAARGGNVGSYNFYRTWFTNYDELLTKGGELAGIDSKIISKVRYESYRNTILSFVRRYRMENSKLNLQDRKCVWKVMKQYPSLWLKTLWWVYTPRKILLLLRKVKHFGK